MTGDLIAVCVFALGIGAVAGTGYLAYVKFFKDRDGRPSMERQVTAGSADDARSVQEKVQAASQTTPVETCPGCMMREPNPAEALPAERKLSVPDENEMAGVWEFDFGSGAASLRIEQGVFQLIYMQGVERRARQYARGTYSYDAEGGVLRLMPQRDFGEPDPVEGVHYGVMTLRAYDVLAYREKSSGDILWTPPEDAATRYDSMHPLFTLTDTGEGAIRWRHVSE